MKTIKITFFLILFLANLTIFSQETLVLEPKIGKTYNFSQKQQELWDTCISSVTDRFPEGKYTTEELNKLHDKCSDLGFSEARDGFWGITSGCSWYCGGSYKNVTVSSSLKIQNDHAYNEKSISDLNYKTAWVEGVKGDGIGEFITYEFPPLNPRITKIIIANGYIKDKKTWQNNARVKQLKMYVDDKFYAILNLKDVYAEQTFEVSPIGYAQRKKSSYKKDGTLIDDMNGKVIPPIKIKFEILEVYKGDKYEDTAITEIYFDGIDVH